MNSVPIFAEHREQSQPISPITGEELQVKFLLDSGEIALS